MANVWNLPAGTAPKHLRLAARLETFGWRFVGSEPERFEPDEEHPHLYRRVVAARVTLGRFWRDRWIDAGGEDLAAALADAEQLERRLSGVLYDRPELRVPSPAVSGGLRSSAR